MYKNNNNNNNNNNNYNNYKNSYKKASIHINKAIYNKINKNKILTYNKRYKTNNFNNNRIVFGPEKER